MNLAASDAAALRRTGAPELEREARGGVRCGGRDRSEAQGTRTAQGRGREWKKLLKTRRRQVTAVRNATSKMAKNRAQQRSPS